MSVTGNILSNVGSSLVRRLMVVLVLVVVIRGIGWLVAPSAPDSGTFSSTSSSSAVSSGAQLIAPASDPLMNEAIAAVTGGDRGFAKAPQDLTQDEIRAANSAYRDLRAERRALSNYAASAERADAGWGSN